jgi:ABC-2 type transport system ATP-binding protein
MQAVIEIEGLRKEYRGLRRGRSVALDGLDLSVEEGGVFGFLGPNGSGKTTTIRTLLGLVRPSSGRARIMGVEATDKRALAGVLGRVGALVEAPALFGGFSGRRNLTLLGRLDGIGKTKIEAVLDRAGLAERAGDPVRSYSLGMRQRLAIAAALLKDPALLILDEPANGLDPAGIVEVRELLRSIGAEGRTVFVSSHLLAEVQHICDRVAILARGRVVAAGLVSDVLAAGPDATIVARVDDQGRGLTVLRSAGFDASCADGLLRVRVSHGDAALVTRTLAEHGLYVSELRSEQNLESVFLDLTEERAS